MINKRATLLFPGEIDMMDPGKNPPDFDCRVLAEGDSWFSFGGWRLQSLLHNLRYSKNTVVVNLAQPGDTVRRMASLAKNRAFEMQLSRQYGYNWDAILFSGGGNDIIDDAGQIIPPSATDQPDNMPAENYCDLNALHGTLDGIVAGYEAIVRLRDGPDSPAPGVPIVTHTYDFVTPRDSPANFLLIRLGPWLYPAMVAARIPRLRWNDVSDFVMGSLGAALIGLEATLPNLHVTQTQGTLKRARLMTRNVSNDWDNEIHANAGGYAKIAKRVSANLDAVLR